MSSEKKPEGQPPQREDKDAPPAWLNVVRDQVASLKFGTVQITIHDSRVIQIEKLEKLRFDRQ
jgi:hypothetical protein